MVPGFWIWDGVVQVLEVDLFSASWEVRHGAAMALRELLKVQGKCGGMRGTFVLPFSLCSSVETNDSQKMIYLKMKTT